MTAAWIGPWLEARGRGTLAVAALRDTDGSLRAGATFIRTRAGGLRATVDHHAAHWSAVARSDDDARALWAAVGALPHASVALAALPAGAAAEAAEAALRRAGRRVQRTPGIESPHLVLPASWDDLLAARSRNLRAQVRRSARALERAGDAALRTLEGEAALGTALDAFLRIEGSGWKAAAGTAIASDPRVERLYRTFAASAAQRGWLRLHLLELDGHVVAGDLACRLDGTEYLMKTGFDPAHATGSPGLVLRARVLRRAIEDGLTAYDFLGGPDPYKLRWTDTLRPRVSVRGFRGLRAMPEETWWRAARPALARVRHAYPGGYRLRRR